MNNEWFETLIQLSSSIRLRRRGKFLSLLLAKTAKKLQRPLNRESASATCKCHGGDAKSTTIFVWFWHRFFFFLTFSQKLRGRVTSLWSVKACPAILDRWFWVLALPLVVAPPNLQNQLTLTSEGAWNYHGFDRSLQNASVGGEGLEKYNPGKSVCKRD